MEFNHLDTFGVHGTQLRGHFILQHIGRVEQLLLVEVLDDDEEDVTADAFIALLEDLVWVNVTVTHHEREKGQSVSLGIPCQRIAVVSVEVEGGSMLGSGN